MGKTAPNKKKTPASIHSRAAKRASSPGIDLDKSLKDLKPPEDAKTSRPSVLAVHQGAGVSKKSKNGRKSVPSSKARKRQEKGLDRAEAFMDKKELKVEKSKDSARTLQERSKAWEELNKKILAKKEAEEAERLEKETEDWVDEDEMVDEEVVAEKEMDDDVPESIPLPEEDEDEIL
ncbi:hypothetical protein LOCC1_G002947 [Lachnellula occidentalis]|uniref:Alb1-domain-containing protein n=1 Tax=Lachnellula occidentalis TaxID=215460 RepID=A0A8H8S6V5_9HELO|nr:hypothetical protein LOCC1_G002947 [Lachnellula occidentalis]